MCLPKPDLQISETEKPPDHNQSQSITLQNKCRPSASSSLELQNVPHFQPPTLPTPASFTSFSLTPPPMPPTSGPENLKSDNKDSTTPYFSPYSHESDGTTWSTLSTGPISATSPNLHYQISAPVATTSALFDSSSDNAFNTQAEGNEKPAHDNSLSAYGDSSFMLPVLPAATLDFHFPSFPVASPQSEALSQSPKDNEKYSLSGGSGACLSDTPTNTHRKDEETLAPLSSLSHKDKPVAPIPSLVLDSSCTTLSCVSRSASIPVCHPPFSSQIARNRDALIDPAVGTVADTTERSICPQDRPNCHDENKNSETEDTLQINEKEEIDWEEDSDIVQTRKTVIHSNSNTESSASVTVSMLASEEAWDKTETEPHVHFCSSHELPSVKRIEEMSKVFHGDVIISESELPRSSLVLHEDVPEAQSRTEAESKDLIKTDSFDLEFQTSVDGSEGENGDVDAFFRQVDTEGLVYWAEPIQVSSSTSVLEESGSSEASDGCSGNYELPQGPALSDIRPSGRPLSLLPSTTVDTDQSRNAFTASSNTHSSSSLASLTSSLATPNLKKSSRSVSVQMSSSLSSHIVHRKDIPYMCNSKCASLSNILPLDTSTPFRAVQSWTDLQIQRNTLNSQVSCGAHPSVSKKVSIHTSVSEITQRPAVTNDPRMVRNVHTGSGSVDKGLWPEEEVDKDGNEDEDKLWEGNQRAPMAWYCKNRCACCTQRSYNKQRTVGKSPVSNNILCITYPYLAFISLVFSLTESTILHNSNFKMRCLMIEIQVSQYMINVSEVESH